MANATSVTILQDGPKNTRVLFQGVLDTSDLGSTTVVDPALLSDLGPFTGMKAGALRIDKVDYDVEDLLEVRLFWDATTPVRISGLTGRGTIDNDRFKDWNNTKASGWTGKITATTQGWVASAVLSFSITLTLTKQ